MSINFKAVVNAGIHHYDQDSETIEYTSNDIVSTLDLGNFRVMRDIESYTSQDGMGSQLMTGDECTQWLSMIDTYQGNLAKLYIEELMRDFKTIINVMCPSQLSGADMLTKIIRHNGVYVAGFSHNAKKVYFTKDLDNAKRFKGDDAIDFIEAHDDCGHCFRSVNATILYEVEGVEP